MLIYIFLRRNISLNLFLFVELERVCLKQRERKKQILHGIIVRVFLLIDF